MKYWERNLDTKFDIKWPFSPCPSNIPYIFNFKLNIFSKIKYESWFVFFLLSFNPAWVIIDDLIICFGIISDSVKDIFSFKFILYILFENSAVFFFWKFILLLNFKSSSVFVIEFDFELASFKSFFKFITLLNKHFFTLFKKVVFLFFIKSSPLISSPSSDS